jgi:hypothetical protein
MLHYKKLYSVVIPSCPVPSLLRVGTSCEGNMISYETSHCDLIAGC